MRHPYIIGFSFGENLRGIIMLNTVTISHRNILFPIIIRKTIKEIWTEKHKPKKIQINKIMILIHDKNFT